MNSLWQIIEAFGDLLRWWVIVMPWEQSLRIRGGRHVKVLSPGVHLRVPLLDEVFSEANTLRVNNLPAQTVASKGGSVLVSCVVTYRVNDVRRLYYEVDNVSDTVQAMTGAAVAQYVADGKALKPTTMGSEVGGGLSTELEQYGIVGTRLYITDLARTPAYRLITGGADGWSNAE